MAFHPMRWFQKHRKAFLAGVTIVAMITFVLSFSITGGGDFFAYVSRLLGAERRDNPSVATLYGKRIDQRDVQRTRERRVIANQFMEMAVHTAHENVDKRLREVSAKWEQFQQREVNEALQGRMIRNMMTQNPQFAAQIQPAEMVSQIQQSRTRLNFLRQEMAEKQKVEEARLVNNLIASLDYEYQRWTRMNEPFYFGGSTRLDSLLDFMIWKQQADKLGIQLTDDDIKSAFDQESLQLLRPEQSAELERAVLRNRRGSFQELLGALGDEFRVRLAKAAILGYDPSAAVQIPAAITPHEFYDFFQRTRTEVSVGLLPFAVKNFLAEVKDTPSESDLKALFELYKEQEFRPDSPTPGFKQPRRLTIAYVYARPDSPHYRKAAEVAAAALQLSSPLAMQAQLIDQYEREKYRHPLPLLTESSFVLPFYSDPRKPETVAATIGILGGANSSKTSVLPAIVGYQAALVAQADKTVPEATMRESRRRIPIGASLVLTGANPSPFAASGLWFHLSRQAQYQPLEAVKDELMTRVREGISREFLLTGLGALRKDLEARKGKPEDANKKVEEYVKKYALQVGKTEKPRDQFDIAADPGMRALKDSYLRARAGQDLQAKQFGQLFFNQGKLLEGVPWPVDLTGRGFGESWQTTSEPFLFWKTTDKAAFVPTYEQVKGEVEAAWRFDKARAFARKAAEAEAEAARKAEKGAVDYLTKGTKQSGTFFTLGEVSLLKPQMQFRMGPSRQYVPYSVPETLVEYPRGDFAEQLVSLQNSQATVVLSDRPEANYYATGLVSRKVPTLEDFYVVYRSSAPNSVSSDPLLGLLERERQQRYYQSTMEQLRAEARLTLAKDARKLLDEKDEGTSSDDY